MSVLEKTTKKRTAEFSLFVFLELSLIVVVEFFSSSCWREKENEREKEK